MAIDYPLIAHNNLLDALVDGTGSYAVTVGTDGTGGPFSDCASRDMLRPALPVADAAGAVTVEISLPTATAAEAFIYGAHRHDSTGYKSTGGTFTLEYWDGAAWVALLTAQTVTAQNVSTIYKLPAHTLGPSGAVYKYRLSMAGFTANSTVVVPELFLGPVLEMPQLDYGFDPYHEIYKGSKFEALSGRVYKNLHFKRLELKPRWAVMERSTYDAEIDIFRESTLETMRSFWWAWQPDSLPNETYMMLDNGTSTSFPIKSPQHRSMALSLVEDI